MKVRVWYLGDVEKDTPIENEVSDCSVYRLITKRLDVLEVVSCLKTY